MHDLPENVRNYLINFLDTNALGFFACSSKKDRLTAQSLLTTRRHNYLKAQLQPPNLHIKIAGPKTILYNPNFFYVCDGTKGKNDDVFGKNMDYGSVQHCAIRDQYVTLMATKDKLYAYPYGPAFERRRGASGNLTEVNDVYGNIKQLAVSSHHLAVLTDENNLFTCGGNGSGQLGLNHPNECHSFTLVPNTPPNIQYIALGDAHTFLLTAEGELFACGFNQNGQLGLNDTQSRNSFTPVTQLPGRVQKIATSRTYSAIVSNEKLYICGDNKNLIFTEVNIPEPIEHVEVGYGYTAVLTKKHTLYVCGLNDYGQLGLGHNQHCATFTKVIFPEEILQIVAGPRQMFVVTVNNFYACGMNNFGQLGLGDKENRNSFTKITQLPPEINKIYSELSRLTEENEPPYIIPTLKP